MLLKNFPGCVVATAILACAAPPSGAQDPLNLHFADDFYRLYLQQAIEEGLHELRSAPRLN